MYIYIFANWHLLHLFTWYVMSNEQNKYAAYRIAENFCGHEVLQIFEFIGRTNFLRFLFLRPISRSTSAGCEH